MSESSDIPEHQREENLQTTELRIILNGDGSEAAEVLRLFAGEGTLLADYSVVPGEMLGTTEMTVTVPSRPRGLVNINRAVHPAELLARVESVLRVKEVQNSARHHVRLITNIAHPDAMRFAEQVEELGGHAQGRDRNKIRLTADRTTKGVVMAVAGAIPGLVHRVRVNPVHSIVDLDHPDALPVDVTRSPDFAQAAKRHTVNIQCHPTLSNDSKMMDILSAAGFRVASMASKIREDSEAGDVQDIVIMVHEHNGNTFKLQRAIAEIMSLVGVWGADYVDEQHLSQFAQATFPLNMRQGMEQLSERHKNFRHRQRMATNFELVASGSDTPGEQARLLKSLAQAGLRRRPSPVIVSGPGVPLPVPKRNWPSTEEMMTDDYRNSMFKIIERHLAGRERGDK